MSSFASPVAFNANTASAAVYIVIACALQNCELIDVAKNLQILEGKFPDRYEVTLA
jgi:hypothetical protein